MSNPMNLDPKTLENLQKMMGDTDISEVMSKISPEMINNFSQMLSAAQNNSSNNSNNINNNKNPSVDNDNNINKTNNYDSSTNYNSGNNSYYNQANYNGGNNNYDNQANHNSGNNNYDNQTNHNSGNNNLGFDFNNIDINTLMKISSAFNSMNQKNDPRANLLASLKPYLRDSKKGKLDSYVNLLKFSKIAEVLKNENKDSQNNKENQKNGNNK